MYMILVLPPVIVRLRVRVNSVTGNGKGWVHRFAAVVGRVRAASLGLYHSSCVAACAGVSRISLARRASCARVAVAARARFRSGGRGAAPDDRAGRRDACTVFASYRRRNRGETARVPTDRIRARPRGRWRDARLRGPGAERARARAETTVHGEARARRQAEPRVLSVLRDHTLTDR